MVVDVTRLQAAIDWFDNENPDEASIPHLQRMGDAARMVAVAPTIQWCETHNVSGWNEDECWQQVWADGDDYVTDRCVIVGARLLLDTP